MAEENTTLKTKISMTLIGALLTLNTFANGINNPWECADVKRVADASSGQTHTITQVQLIQTGFGPLVGQVDGLTLQALTLPESIMTEANAAVSIFKNPADTTTSGGHEFAHIMKTQIDPQNNEARNYIVACINRDIHPDSSTREGDQFQRMLDSVD